MKIEQVAIKGFQSHVDSTFQLSQGLTVITGPSDAGKTAIIRALRWLAFNEPQGEAFLHTIRNADGSVKAAVEQASVEVLFDNGITITKTRRKGKTTYTHSLYQEPWEKAEIPPEIKETLGLMKQEYGDFSTCLNFAFQLDAPFLLSETASVGAKVLGKIAGTEVVDKSIGEVNKRTHKARLDATQAEKTIGQLDVELLEYLTLDDTQAAYDEAEARFTKLQVDIGTQEMLRDLLTSYQLKSTTKVSLWDKLQPLQVVTLLKPRLQTVEYNQDKLEAIKELEVKFWTAVKDSQTASATIRKLESVGDLSKQLLQLNDKDKALEVLRVLTAEHTRLVLVTEGLETTIGKSEAVLMKKYQLYNAENTKATLDVLNGLRDSHILANSHVETLKATMVSLEGINVLRTRVQAQEKVIVDITKLEAINQEAAVAIANLHTADIKLKWSEDGVEIARKELREAWEVAGGICPLCGKELEECIH